MKGGIDCFLKPKSVAIIGASTKTGPGSFNILEIVKARGYGGELYPVNPKAGEILGLQAYPSVLDIPGEVDLAVISTGRSAVLELVRECVKKPVKGIIIIAQGFADAGPEGKKLQDQIFEVVSGTGTRVIGPNTVGVINNFDNFLSVFINIPARLAPVGVICQSGPIIGAHEDIFNGAGYGVDIGNAADIGFNEVLDFYGREDRIELINLHMEGIRGGREFVALSSEIAGKKPIIVYKTGRTAEGARAAGSHSGSLAGEDHVYQAAFKKAGIIRAESFDELKDFNKSFLKYKHVPGNRVAVVTYTGGGGIALLDAMERSGLVPATLSPETAAKIKKIFPGWLDVSNPVDIWPSAMAYGYREVCPLVLDSVLNDPGVDMMVCVSVTHSMPQDGEEYFEKFVLDAAAKRPEKPVALWGFGSAWHEMAVHVENRGPVAVFSSPERLARALGAICEYYRRGLKAAVSAGKPAKSASAVISPKSRGVVLGAEAMEILRAAGILTVRGKLAGSLEEAVKAAEEIGYPLAIKVVSREIVHKTEAGGIRLDIRDRSDLENAYRSLLAGVDESVPGLKVEGVLVQEYVSVGVELLLGSSVDSEFGPVLVFGLGGIYTEILRDVSFRLAPLDRAGALEMIKETRAYKLLEGARGKARADIEALVDAVVSFSDLVVNNPVIREADINPLLATPKGVVAVDARFLID